MLAFPLPMFLTIWYVVFGIAWLVRSVDVIDVVAIGSVREKSRIMFDGCRGGRFLYVLVVYLRVEERCHRIKMRT